MNDLQQGLIAGRGKKESGQMRKRFEECQLKVKTLRNKNNQLQKQCDNDLMEGDIKSAIKAQTGFIENEISDLKKALEQLSKNYTDPSSKNKIKEICSLASRQMQRNKRIMQQFMNRASTSPSIYKRQSYHPFNKSKTQMQKQDQIFPVRGGNSIIASEDMLSEIKAQQKMLAERNALLKQLQQKNNRINQIMNEMGEMVGGEQRDMVNQIDDNLIAVKHNLQDTNEEMDQAIVYQKKSKKKYICIIGTIVVILLVAFGLIYFLVINK